MAEVIMEIVRLLVAPRSLTSNWWVSPAVEGKIHPSGFCGIFNEKALYFHEPRVGTDTTGPGEAVLAIRIVKFQGIT